MGQRLTEPDFPVQLKSFYGGQDRGRCLAVSSGELTQEQAITLMDHLRAWAGEDTTVSRRITIGDWIVGAGATRTMVPVTKIDGQPIIVTKGVADTLARATIYFDGTGMRSALVGVQQDGTLFPENPLPRTPKQGEHLTLIVTEEA